MGAMIIEQLYDALIAAGAPEDKARDAARAVAGYDTRLNHVERDLSVLKWMGGGSRWRLGLAISGCRLPYFRLIFRYARGAQAFSIGKGVQLRQLAENTCGCSARRG